MNGADKEQIRRIKRYEKIFDKASKALKRYNEAAEKLDMLLPEIKTLISYYEGSEWKKDFEDDEKGKLPPDLKRGVLSEDGVYDLLGQFDEALKNINREK